jgi:hypothetical protein
MGSVRLLWPHTVSALVGQLRDYLADPGARDARASFAGADIGRVYCRRRPPERATPVPER